MLTLRMNFTRSLCSGCGRVYSSIESILHLFLNVDTARDRIQARTLTAWQMQHLRCICSRKIKCAKDCRNTFMATSYWMFSQRLEINAITCTVALRHLQQLYAVTSDQWLGDHTSHSMFFLSIFAHLCALCNCAYIWRMYSVHELYNDDWIAFENWLSVTSNIKVVALRTSF